MRHYPSLNLACDGGSILSRAVTASARTGAGGAARPPSPRSHLALRAGSRRPKRLKESPDGSAMTLAYASRSAPAICNL